MTAHSTSNGLDSSFIGYIIFLALGESGLESRTRWTCWRVSNAIRRREEFRKGGENEVELERDWAGCESNCQG